MMLTVIGIYARPLTPIDETRYISVAWEMWLRGDFLVPVKNGLPYSDKPPLLMWLYQAGWAVFGVNEWWPRLVSPLCSAASLWLVYRLARRLWPEQPGVGGMAALVLGSSLLWLIFSTASMFDVLLALLTLVGAHGTLSAAQGKRSGFVVLGLAIALGVLAKGPVIVLHCLPVALLALWWQPALAWRSWLAGLGAAVLLGATIALVWAIPAGLAGGEAYQRAIFWGQTAERMVQSFAHQRPFWWYLPTLPLLLFPWLLWPALWRGSYQLLTEKLDLGSRFCIAWLIPVLLALSLISGKQVHYLLPLFPVFALFAARSLAGRTLAGVAGLPVAAILLGSALLALAAGLIPLPKGFSVPPALPPALLLIALAPVTWLLARRMSNPLPVLAIFAALLVALLQLSFSPALRADYDIAPLASAISSAQTSGLRVANDGIYHDQFHFSGRLERPLLEFTDEERLAEWLQQHPDTLTVMYLKKTEAQAVQSAIVRQGFRGEVAVLLDAPTALRLLAVQLGHPLQISNPARPEPSSDGALRQAAQR
ncbi:glycosyltransferase [Pseudomonas alcaligenes]|uniref:Glycosyltransferase n=1 Tax=Aquipseudomonas alcaligenes TaxID=43263 RepID=A0ABR7S1P7_AQUAC|nr:glycosyltransferase family 39 protein [Pseudomonas alcaligenes]MBC9250725.1 glycosyltransferase [Pseudomonas alcaligenes]